ncbi:MAG: cob(I)yrinic acid a,c-diamide adenosyltransferase [bacterium]
MSIYTGRGDKGQTDLFSGERVSKTNYRIEAYGTVDELNSLIGVAISFLENQDKIDEISREIQNHLHIICASLANTNRSEDQPEIKQENIEWLEDTVDELEESLPDLQSFILPGGSKAGSHFHLARSVCRRAERRTVIVQNQDEDNFNPKVVKYLNRLSDALFVMGRSINHEQGEKENSPSY